MKLCRLIIASATVFLLGGILLFVLGGATPSPPTAIGYIDLDKVTRLAKPVQQTISDVEEEIKPQKEEAEKKMEQLDLLRLSYERQRSVLSEEQRKTRQQEISKLQEEISKLTDEINQKLEKMETERLSPTYDKIMEMVKKVAQNKGLKIVLARETIIWAEDALDISDEVISELNLIKPTAISTEAEKTLSRDTLTTGVVE